MKKYITLVFIVLLVTTAQADSNTVHQWQLLKEKSSIGWTASYGGRPVHGQFPEFTADITFDASLLDKSHASIKISTTHIESSDHDARENLPTKEWFASTDYPFATFETKSFKAIDKGRFEAAGMLTLHGKSVPVILPFTLEFVDAKDGTHSVRMNGEATLKRLDFGIGTGEWVSTDTVANVVDVTIHLEAKMVP